MALTDGTGMVGPDLGAVDDEHFFCGSVIDRSGGNATSPLWLIQDSFFGRG